MFKFHASLWISQMCGRRVHSIQVGLIHRSLFVYDPANLLLIMFEESSWPALLGLASDHRRLLEGTR
jgi:hypothetical protein